MKLSTHVACFALAAMTAITGTASTAQVRRREPPAGSYTAERAPDSLITTHGIGGVRLGMTIARLRRRLPRAEYEAKPFGEMPVTMEVRVEGAPLFYFTTTRMEEAESERLEDEDAITMLATDNPRYRTEQGVGPGSSVEDAVAAYGAPKFYHSPDGEYVRFARAPARFGFAVSPPQGSRRAGVYGRGTRREDGYEVTTRFRPGSRISSVSVSSG